MTSITRQQRSQLKRQRPCVLWLTGFSGAGKSTIANLVEQELFARGHHTFLLDGDNVRRGLCSDLGFSIDARNENIRRIGETAKLFTEAGVIVLSATISPLQTMRDKVRDLFAPGEFIEIFIDAPLTLCEERDTKGLYRKARNGEIALFTGIDSSYEPPQDPEIHLKTDRESAGFCAQVIIDYLLAHQYLEK